MRVQIVLGKDGSKIWEECDPRTPPEEQIRWIVQKDTESARPATGEEEPEQGWCQDFKTTQEQRRTCTTYDCTRYAAEKKTSGWWIVGGAVLLVGAIVLTGGVVGLALGAAKVIGVATSVVVLTGTGIVAAGTGTLVIAQPTGDDPDDYEKGQVLATGEVIECTAWADHGSPTREDIGDPRPC